MIASQMALVPLWVLVVGAIGALAASGRPRLATWIGAGSAGLASAFGLAWTAWIVTTGRGIVWDAIPWWRMPLASFIVGLDPLSAFFAVPVFGLGGLCALYGATYLRVYEGKKNLGAAWFAYDLLLAGMSLLLLARNGVLLLFAWEVMSLAAWGLVSFEHEKPETRRAGWIYLVATHIGAAALFVLFLLLLQVSGGSPDFTDLRGHPAPASVLLVLALVGFGAKAGLFPFHVWLPEAHAAAPSHVSAVMSGVMVNMGLYGILRIALIVGAPWWLGPALLLLGFIGALTGIGMALSQRDLKRVLAYSTVENVGIICIGLGVGFLGMAWHRPEMAALGVSGALLHVWNHTMMKGLMFLGAGSVVHGAGTKDLESLGGLMGRMPTTGALMTLGAVAIAALPPLNGFTGEWLIYGGLLDGGGAMPGAQGLSMMFGVGLLAFVGALAAATFAKVIAMVFLGQSRSEASAHAHESTAGMLAPMAMLAAGCVAVGVAPQLIVQLLGPVVNEITGAPIAGSVASVASLGPWAAAVWLGVAVIGVGLARSIARAPIGASGTWDCGYAEPSAKMQYSARSFSRLGADSLLPRALQPVARVDDPPKALLPGPSRLTTTVPDPVLERGYLPIFGRIADQFAGLRRLQDGRMHLYVGYIGVCIALALAWSALRSWGGS